MDKKTKLYIGVAVGTLALILVVVSAVVYFRGGDPTLPGAAAAVAAAVAGAASTKRTEARASVDGAVSDGAVVKVDAQENLSAAKGDMAAVVDEVTAADRDAKVAEGDKLFG